MVACQFEAEVDKHDKGDTGKAITILGIPSQDIQEENYHTQPQSKNETVLDCNSNTRVHSLLHRPTSIISGKEMDDKNKHKKKKFKPANELYCFEVDGIFNSTRECVTERIIRRDLDYSDVDQYFECFEPVLKVRCNGLELYRSTKKKKLQKVHTQIRDDHFDRSKCIGLATGRSYHIKQRLVTRQTIRKEYVDENITAHKANAAKTIRKMGIKLKGVCRPLESETRSNYHPKRLQFDEEEKRRKEPRRIVKEWKTHITEKKREPRRITPSKPATPKRVQFPDHALHEGNITNVIDNQTKALIDLQYRDLTSDDMELLFKLDTEVVIKKSLDEQMERDIAVVQKSIADAKQLEEKIRQDSSRMLELMMQLQFRELSPEDYELLLRLDETVKPKVATSKAIRSLGTLEVGPEQLGHCCLICMDDYVKGDILKVLPCEHTYHTNCIDNWLAVSSNKCPLDSVEVL